MRMVSLIVFNLICKSPFAGVEMVDFSETFLKHFLSRGNTHSWLCVLASAHEILMSNSQRLSAD